jgi:hypothetical protein
LEEPPSASCNGAGTSSASFDEGTDERIDDVIPSGAGHLVEQGQEDRAPGEALAHWERRVIPSSSEIGEKVAVAQI